MRHTHWTELNWTVTPLTNNMRRLVWCYYSANDFLFLRSVNFLQYRKLRFGVSRAQEKPWALAPPPPPSPEGPQNLTRNHCSTPNDLLEPPSEWILHQQASDACVYIITYYIYNDNNALLCGVMRSVLGTLSVSWRCHQLIYGLRDRLSLWFYDAGVSA